MRGCSTSSASPTSRFRSTAMSAPATGSTSRTSRRSCRSPSAAGPSPGWSRAKSSSTSCFDCPRTSATIPRSSAGSRSTRPARTASRGREFRCSNWSISMAHKPGATYIYRENNRRYIPIKFSVKDRDLASTIAEAQRKVNDPKYWRSAPAGLRHRLGGRVSTRWSRPTTA